MGPGPQSSARACNHGRSNYLVEQLPWDPRPYIRVMSPRAVCLPAPPEPSLVTLVVPASLRLHCLGVSVWKLIVANHPGSQLTSGLWEWGLQAKRDPGDVGVGAAGQHFYPRKPPASSAVPILPPRPTFRYQVMGSCLQNALPFHPRRYLCQVATPLHYQKLPQSAVPAPGSPQPVPAFSPGLSLVMLPQGLWTLPSLALKGLQ